MGLTKSIIQSLVLGFGLAVVYIYVLPNGKILLTSMHEPVTDTTLGLLASAAFFVVIMVAKVLSRGYK